MFRELSLLTILIKSFNKLPTLTVDLKSFHIMIFEYFMSLCTQYCLYDIQKYNII